MKLRREFLVETNDCLRADLSYTEVVYFLDMINKWVKSSSVNSKFNEKIEPLTGRQMICSQNAINYLFDDNLLEFLHEVYDIIHNYCFNDCNINCSEYLSYNEYVLLSNLFSVYDRLKEEGRFNKK